jgi:hypothetical protein
MVQQREVILKKPAKQGASDNGAGQEAFAEKLLGRRKPPETGRFRLQVDRQTKASYVTREAAEQAGLAIKRGFPIVRVTVFDADEGQSETIVLPAA